MTNDLAVAAWDLAVKGTANGFVEELPPRVQYALRRIGGAAYLETQKLQFVEAFNEAPIVDYDLDTQSLEMTLVRPKEPKDGGRS